jgi:septum site-determining protein MinC
VVHATRAAPPIEVVEAAEPVPEKPADPAAASEIAAPPCAEAPSEQSVAAAPTLIIDRPLRSGQQVYARGGDLVVLGAVNFGAELIADGSIHVYAPLRGKAIAGARGNTSARIFSTCMEPELISIAGTYRTTDNPLPAEVIGKPAQIRLDGERLVYEPLA